MKSARALDRDRLAKLLGLVGSAHDGEVVTAARKAHALVIAVGLTWREVVQPADERPDRPTVDEPAELARTALDLHAAGQLHLTAFEMDFLRTIARWRGRLSKVTRASGPTP